MKACTLHAPGDLRIDDVPRPKCSPTTAIVRVRSCAICGSDVHILRGEHPRALPFRMGHEAAGEVIEVGDQAEGLSVGERITWWVSYGSMAELVEITPAEVSIGRLGAETTYEEGATTQLLTAVIRALTPAEIGPGDRVLVVGLGGVGSLAIQCARAMGAASVVAADLHANRVELAVRLGADAAFVASGCEVPRLVGSVADSVTVVVDAAARDLSPGKTLMADALACLEDGGRYLAVGLPPEERRFSPLVLSERGLRVIPAYLPVERVRPLCQQACDWVADGTIDVASLVSTRARLEEAPRVFEQVIGEPHRIVKASLVVEG